MFPTCDRFAGPEPAHYPYDCPRCGQTTERKKDGEPRLTECADAACKAMLCPACPRFYCDGCQLTHCPEHATALGGDKFCPDCMKEIQEIAEEAAKEAREEVA